MRKIAIICFLACISVLANAQNITITPEVTSLDDRAVVEYNNMICATEGATAIYRVTVEDCDSIDSVSVCQYRFNEVEHEATFTLDNGVIIIDEISLPLVVGPNQFTFMLTIQEVGKDSLTELSQEATDIQIYPVPTHQEVSAPSSLVYYKETGKLTWTAHGDGGAKWEYTWTSSEKLTVVGESFVHPSITNSSTTEKKVIVTLSATNYAPDGVTVWDSYSDNWTISIIPETVVNTAVSPNTSENPYKKFQGDSWDLAVSTVGGNPNGWIIEWLDGDNNILLGQGLDCKVTSSSSDRVENKHIILHVTNTAVEGITSDNNWYDQVFHYYVRFYPIPQIAFSSSYPKDVLHGEKIQMGVKLVNLQMEEDYVINYEWNGKNNGGASYLFEAINGGNKDSIEKVVTVKCSFGLVNSDAKGRSSQELSHTFIVWPKPSLYINANENNRSIPYRQFQDGKWEFVVKTYGGFPTGWKIVWKDETGKEVGQGENYTMKCDTSSDGVQEKHVILTVTNRAQGRTDLWFEHTYNYYAAFYPAPIVKFEKEYPHHIKHGDKVVMKLTVMDAKGNSLSDAYDWNVSWNNGQSKNVSYEFVGENQSNDDGVSQKIEVDCSIELKGTNLKQTYSREVDFVVWPIPKVTTNIDNLVGCAGQTFDYSITTSGGKKDGWSYVWTLNNQNLNVNSNKYKLILENSSIKDSIVNHYKVRATNICENEVWFEEEYPFTVIVYPEPKVPEKIFVMDLNRGVEVSSGIREGNNILLHCDECTGGNPNAWSYKWLRNNSIFGTNNEINDKLTSNYSGNGKANNLLVEYDCVVENTYNTVSWKKQDYKKEIRVYRKPQTPTGLQRKGNGTSGTWIATCGIDDASLGANDYYLVFGYQDAEGKMHDVSTMKQQNVGEQRWSSSQTAFNGNAYVYALWKYDDGSEVTSGLCMESSVDENWDGSTYDGSTRSVIEMATGISIISSTQIQENAEYYSLDGIKTNQMKKGINIVRRKDGQIVKIVNNK